MSEKSILENYKKVYLLEKKKVDRLFEKTNLNLDPDLMACFILAVWSLVVLHIYSKTLHLYSPEMYRYLSVEKNSDTFIHNFQ